MRKVLRPTVFLFLSLPAVLAASALLTATAYANPKKIDWLLPYVGKSSSDLAWDPKFKPLLQSSIPKQSHAIFGRKATPLSDAAIEMLGGPPSDVKQDGKAVYFSSCRAQSCDEKSLFFADTADSSVTIALVHFIWKGAYKSQPDLLVISSGSTLPKNFKSTIKNWLGREKISPQVTRLVNSTGLKNIQLDESPAPAPVLKAVKLPAQCGSREYAFDPNRIPEQQLAFDHLLNPSGAESPSAMFLTAKDATAQRQIHQNFLEVSKKFSRELAPLIRFWSTFMEGSIAMEEAEAGFIAKGNIQLLEAPVVGIKPGEKCTKVLAELKAAPPEKQKKLVRSSWHNCINHAIQDKIGASPSQADWDKYLKAYGMTEKAGDQDDCG